MVLYVVMYCVRVVRLYIETIVQHDKDFRRELKKTLAVFFFMMISLNFRARGKTFFVPGRT